MAIIHVRVHNLGEMAEMDIYIYRSLPMLKTRDWARVS